MTKGKSYKKPDKSEELENLFEISPPLEIDEQEDIKSEKEQEALFSFEGPYSNFDEYMRHEEFFIKKLNSQSERKLREENAKLAFKFSAYWAGFIALIILFKGFSKSVPIFSISDNVFLVIIGSLTASILVFYSLVLKYLFNIKNDKADK